MALKLDRNIRYMVILEETKKTLARDCSLAADFLRRLKGLMFRDNIEEEEALLIVPCNSIHTFFMRFPVDLVFIDCDGNAVTEMRRISPGRALKPVRGAWATLELKGGRLDSLGLTGSIIGSRIVFKAH